MAVKHRKSNYGAVVPVDAFLTCFPLRFGVIFIGILSLTLAFSLKAFQCKKLINPFGSDVVDGIYFLLHITSSILLLVGVTWKCSRLMLPWLSFYCITLTCCGLALPLLFKNPSLFWPDPQQLWPNHIADWIIFMIYFMSWYMWFVVYSCYEILKQLNKK